MYLFAVLSELVGSRRQYSSLVLVSYMYVCHTWHIYAIFAYTVNTLKIRELFVHFKSYLLKLGGNINFFAFFLRKLEPSCKIGEYSAAIFRKVLYRKCPPLTLSLSQYRALFCGYHVYKEVWNPSIGEEFVCPAEEENSHDRKAVISWSDDIASELSSDASTVVKHCSRAYIAIKQYPGVPPLPKLEVLPNFRVAH